MKRHFVKGTTMLLLAVALAFVAAASTNAQSRSRAEVPWEFVANNATLPAGQYLIADASANQVIKLSNTRQAKSVFAMTVGITRKGSCEKGKLVFHRYGNRYFLAEIFLAGEREGQKLQKSREEKSIERELAIIYSKTELPQKSFERVEIALVTN